jgi:hypothetical protein
MVEGENVPDSLKGHLSFGDYTGFMTKVRLSRQ